MTSRIPRVAAGGALLLLAACGSPTPPPNLPAPKASPPPSASGTAAPASPPSGQPALAAATSFATLFFSVDYRTVDDYSDQVEAATTGAFHADFVAKRSQLKQTLTQARSSAHGHVLALAPRDVKTASAHLLIAADQDVTNASTNGKAVTNHFAIDAELQQVDGRWLVADFQPVVAGVHGEGCPDDDETPDRDDLLRETCNDLETLFSYDYRTIDADIAAQRSTAVGSARTELDKTTPTLREQAPTAKAQVVTTASTAAIEHFDGDSATVLAFVSQSLHTSRSPEPEDQHDRIEATMQRVGGRWLVAGVKLR